MGNYTLQDFDMFLDEWMIDWIKEFYELTFGLFEVIVQPFEIIFGFDQTSINIKGRFVGEFKEEVNINLPADVEAERILNKLEDGLKFINDHNSRLLELVITKRRSP